MRMDNRQHGYKCSGISTLGEDFGMRNTLVVLIALASLWTGVSWSSEPMVLPDETLTKYVDYMVRTNAAGIPSGEMTVVNTLSNFSWSKRTISSDHYNWLRAAEKVGFVSIVLDEDFERFQKGEKKTFDWRDFDAVSKGGAIHKINVTLTPEGTKLPEHKDPKDWRSAYLVTSASVQLVSKEYKSDGVDHFFLLMARYKAEWSPIAKEYFALTGAPWENERKVAVLFKWDPFKKVWKDSPWEETDMSKDLDMTNIRKALGDAR